jgi:carbon-monoxide dehydrogenase medium subunit
VNNPLEKCERRVKPAAFEYHAPETIDEALELLGEYGDDAKVLAGGQSLVPMLALRLTSFDHLIDINRAPALRGIEEQDGMVSIGSATRQASVERHGPMAAATPLLARAVKLIGHFQIRNRGTVGGSIAHADGTAELPVVALTLDATLEVASTRGRRQIAAADFFVGPWTTSMDADELLIRASFPTAGRRAGYAFEEVARRPGDFGLAGAGVALRLGDDLTIAEVAIGLLGMGATPLRAPSAEAVLIGTHGDAASLQEISHLAISDGDPRADIHASRRYRAHVGAHLVATALSTALEEARSG